MNAYAWMITRDHLDNSDATIIGPWDASHTPEDIAKNGTAFRMYDDDGELYYSGRIVGDFDGLEPLEDFGMPAAGCTEIRLFMDGKWRTV